MVVIMKAVVFRKYGPPEQLAIEELATPTPKPDQVLVRVHAATVSAEDPKLRGFQHPALLRLPIALLMGYPRPRVRVLGMELSGVVAAVGAKVERFRVGDAVFGYTGIGLGAHAEYCCLSDRAVIAHKPSELSFEDAAALPNSALTALIYLRNMATLASGERVLVYGASGAVGSAAVQLAKYFSAEVTGVCSTRNVELVRSLGADRVIDYTKQHFTDEEQIYDVVFDTVGKTHFSNVRQVLSSNGRYLITEFGMRELLQMLSTRLGAGPRVLGGASNFHWTAADLELIAEMSIAGQFRAVIDRCYPMSEVAQAHRYVETKRKRGNVVLRMTGD
jgi:NADPH:quinone reductase-like Zn-dependent oxidoreductase